jgi:hypothetical protein
MLAELSKKYKKEDNGLKVEVESVKKLNIDNFKDTGYYRSPFL